MGRQIPGTRFICFKVPLRVEIVQNAVSRGAEWFCPRTLMDHCHNLGIIVDLTNTDRYYNSSDFTSQGIKHIKIPTMGKVVPSPKVFKQFFKTVHRFLEENKENEKLIGVHCTHGLNRTGYLVCRYMIEHLGVPPDQAISDFNSARGHDQEREEYLCHLRQLKWQQEPAVSSDSENESAKEVKTPTGNQRRAKRNFDAIRGEDDNDDSWPTGPARKWPRTPHTERRDYEQQHWQYNRSSRTPRQSYRRLSSENPRHKVQTSPFGGQRYYDSYYQGRAAPQYDFNFYQQQGSGLGPHRNSPRSRNVRWENNSTRGRPRQYQGPRQYATPPKRERERLDFNDDTPNNKRSTPTAHGSRQNPLSPGPSSNVFSPGDSNTFSPAAVVTSWRRSNTFSPENSKTFSPRARSYRRK
ncbi:RNA/RNP complex-1-interacting phosphatase-like isoform X2 [Macrobrachium nipponense]